jgi:hypothetical protein
MYFYDNKQHKLPHIHVEYQGRNAIIALDSGEIIDGEVPNNKLHLVRAWIEIHREELMANWALAVKGEQLFKIEPLK